MSPEKGIMSKHYQNQCTVLCFDSFSSVVTGRNDSHLVIKRSSPLRIHCDAHTLCHQRFCNKQEESFSDGYAEKCQMFKVFQHLSIGGKFTHTKLSFLQENFLGFIYSSFPLNLDLVCYFILLLWVWILIACLEKSA